MKVNKIRILLFIIVQAMLWQKTNCTFKNFQCKGMTEEETQKLEKRFQDMALIGQGSTGEVRACKEYVIKKVITLKFTLEDFNREIRTILAFENSLEIVKFYKGDQGHRYEEIQCFYPQNQGKYTGYLVLPKYFTSLHKYISVKESKLIQRIGWKFDMMIKLSIAIKKFHDNGFIHCDIKPENIFMLDQFTPILADLGESITFKEHKENKAGTNEYLAPEIREASSNFPYTYKVDIFALGIVFVDLIAGKISKFNFIPSQENFKINNIEQFYEFDEDSRKMYEDLEPLILKMTSDIPNLRPSADELLKDIFKYLKQYLYQDQSTNRLHVQLYGQYLNLQQALYQKKKSPNDYHANLRNQLFINKKKLIEIEEQYFVNGKLNLYDKFFQLNQAIPSVAYNTKNNPELQFIEKSGLQGKTGFKFQIKKSKIYVPQEHGNSQNNNTTKQNISTIFEDDQISKSYSVPPLNTQKQPQINKLFSYNTQSNIDEQKPMDFQDFLQQSQKTSSIFESLRKPQRSFFDQNTVQVYNLSKSNNSSYKTLEQKNQEKEEQKKKEEQLKLVREKNRLIHNEYNIVDSALNSLQQQLNEYEHQEVKNKIIEQKYMSQKQELFDQAKIVIELLKKEKENLNKLRFNTPQQVKSQISQVQQRVIEAQNKANDLQNKFYSIEKQINEEILFSKNNQSDDEIEQLSLFNEHVFDFIKNQNDIQFKGRQSTIHHLKKEFSEENQRMSLPARVNISQSSQDKHELIQNLKNDIKKALLKQFKKKNRENQSQKKSKESENNQRKNRFEENNKNNTKNKKKNIIFQEEPKQRNSELKNKLQSKIKLLEILLPKRNQSTLENFSIKKEQFRREITESQSLQSRKLNRNKGNRWKRVLI